MGMQIWVWAISPEKPTFQPRFYQNALIKKSLLLAYYDYLIDLTKQSFSALRKTKMPALDMLKQVFLMWTTQVETPAQFANLASIYLGNNQDPEFIEKQGCG